MKFDPFSEKAQAVSFKIFAVLTAALFIQMAVHLIVHFTK